jgi:hypothetical protein
MRFREQMFRDLAPAPSQIQDSSDHGPNSAGLNPGDHPFRQATTLDPARDLSICFQRLANFDSAAFERLGRYESALARQIVQVIFLLNSTRRR